MSIASKRTFKTKIGVFTRPLPTLALIFQQNVLMIFNESREWGRAVSGGAGMNVGQVLLLCMRENFLGYNEKAKCSFFDSAKLTDRSTQRVLAGGGHDFLRGRKGFSLSHLSGLLCRSTQFTPVFDFSGFGLEKV